MRTRSILPASIDRRTGAWTGGAAVLLVLAMAMPWIQLELRPGVRPLELTVVVAWSSALSSVSYGVLLLVAPVVAAVVTVRTPRIARQALWGAGLGVLAVAIYFVVSTRIDNGATLQRVLFDQESFQNINNLFGQGPVPSTLPVSILGHGADAASIGLFAGLGIGWYCALGAGAALLIASRTVRPQPAGTSRRRRGPVVTAVAAALVSMVAASSLVAAGIGDQRLREADVATVQGQPDRALRLVADASRWNTGFTADPTFDQIAGRALAERGSAQPLADFGRAAGLPGGGGHQFMLYKEALAGRLGSGVSDTVAAYMVGAARTTFLIDLAADYPDDPAVVFAIGVLDFKEGHFLSTVIQMRHLLQETSASWTESVAYTYLAVAQLRLGRLDVFRSDILKAHRLDRSLSNTFASELSAGLYLPGDL